MSTKIRSIILSICLLVLFVMNSMQLAVAYDNPLLEVNVTGYSLTAGDENAMSISIQNIGDTNAFDVKAALAVPSTVSGMSIVKESYMVFEHIYCYSDEPPFGERQTVWMHPVLYVKSNCPLGPYSLTLTLEYTDSSDRTYTDSVQIGVVVDAVKPTEAPLFGINITGYSLTAGDENEMSISIENIGETTAFDVKIALTVPSTVSGISVVKESYVVFEKIDSIHYSQHAEWMHPVLYVSRDCPLGAYSLTLRLDYTDSLDKVYTDSVQIGVVVDAIKPTTVDLDIDAEDYHVTAGTKNEINIIVTNVGEETVYDVEAVLTSDSQSIVILSELSYLFDQIDVGSQVNFRPLLAISKGVPLGAYSLTLTLDYKDSKGVAYREKVTVGLFVDSVEPAERTRIVVQNFQVTPREVFPGDELTVELDLKNLGEKATDVQAKLAIDSESQFVSLGSTLVFVGDLGSNETAEVTYNLRIKGDADATLYVLPLVISYYDVYDQPESLTETISIAIHSIVDFRLIDIQPSVMTAKPGETVTIEADLLLLGTETVDFVEVEIIEDQSMGPFSTVSESYEYVGTVDPDSPVLFTIQFMVDPDATSGNYTLQIRVSCWDGYNEQRRVTIELPIKVTEFSGQNTQKVTNVTLWDIIWTTIRILFGIKP